MKAAHWIKVFLIILLCVALDIFLHLITSKFSTMTEMRTPSIIAIFLGTEISALLWAFSAFSVVAFVFLKIKDQIPGKGVEKGLRFGGSIALLWMLGMIEGVTIFGNPFYKEFIVGLSDAIPVFVLSLSLSVLKNTSSEPPIPNNKKKILALSVFTGIFFSGRMIMYFLGAIRSGIYYFPIQTIIWTLSMGISLGLIYLLLGDIRYDRFSKKRILIFGVYAFGMNWMAFLVFMPLLFSGYLVDVIIRICIDTALVILASWLTVRSSRKNEEKKILISQGGQ